MRASRLGEIEKERCENDRVITAPKPVAGVKQTMDDCSDIEEVPQEKMDEIGKFLIEYSQDQGNKMEYLGTRSASESMKTVRKYMKRFRKKTG